VYPFIIVLPAFFTSVEAARLVGEYFYRVFAWDQMQSIALGGLFVAGQDRLYQQFS
jgi:hypothetical protein